MVKISKEAAKYTPIAKGDDYCRDCRHYSSPGQCGRVMGSINAGGWCKLFSRKRSLAKAVK